MILLVNDSPVTQSQMEISDKQNGSPWVQYLATNGATRCSKCCESSNYISGKQECVADLEYSGTSRD